MRIFTLLLLFIFITPLLHAEQTGNIHLYSKPKIRVYLDGVLIGKTNKSDTVIFIYNVPTGRHTLRLQKRGNSTEVLSFSLYDSLLELESNKYNVGKFTEDIRNSKLDINDQTKANYFTLNRYDRISMYEQTTDAQKAKYKKIYGALESNNYVPSFDEKYKVDTLPRIIYIKYPIYPITDSIPSIEFEEVWIKGLVDTNGTVDTVVVVGSCGNTKFDDLAIYSAYKTEFLPAIKDNKKVWVWITWKIPYRDVYLGEKGFNTKTVSGVFDQIYSDTILSISNSKITTSDSLKLQPLDELPMILTKETPLYPIELLNAGIDGTVWIKGIVSSKGEVLQAEAGVSSGYPELDSAAVTAAYRYSFIPGEIKGKPVDALIAWDIVFDKSNPKIKDSEISDIKLPGIDEFVPVDVMPEMIHYTTPNYPRLAKQRGYQGVDWVKALIDKQGVVIKSRIGKSSGHKVLDIAAVEASFGNKFKPATLNGKKLNVWVTYKVDFKLQN